MEQKVELSGFMSRDDRAFVKKRADSLGMFLGQYIREMAIYEARYNMLPRLRDGARLVGRKRK